MNTDNSMQAPNNDNSLRSYLVEEIKSTRDRLEALKGSLRPDDFNSLEEELKIRSDTLDSLKEEDDTQLFILRREISRLQENLEAMAVKQGWWSRLPVYARILVITVPLVLYLVVLSFIQWLNKGQVYDYPATQTAIAAQTMAAPQATLSGPDVTPLPTLTQVP